MKIIERGGQRQPEKRFSRVKSTLNIIEGYNRARFTLGRNLVDSIETTGFAILFSEQTRTAPRVQAVANTFRLEDILERQNCYGDEKVANNPSENPYWERDHFVFEYADVLGNIQQDISATYGEKGRKERFPKVVEALSTWFIVNRTVENWQANGVQPESLSPAEAKVIEPLLEKGTQPSAKEYRELVDESWLRALLMVLADGDEAAVDTTMKPILNGTLMLQLSEDFANIGRDSRVGKNSFFTESDENGKTVLQRTKTLRKKGAEYLDGLELTGVKRKLAESALVARSLYAYASSMRNPDEWRKAALFSRADEYESQKLERQIATTGIVFES